MDLKRMKEPMTTDESPKVNENEIRRLQEEETKANCPDDYNLLTANENSIYLKSIDELKNTASDIAVETANQEMDPNRPQTH